MVHVCIYTYLVCLCVCVCACVCVCVCVCVFVLYTVQVHRVIYIRSTSDTVAPLVTVRLIPLSVVVGSISMGSCP